MFSYKDPSHHDYYTLSLHDALPIFGTSTYDVNTFGEAAIDLTALFANFNSCLSVGVKTIFIKTKESQSPTANIVDLDRKSTRLNSSHRTISYAVFCLKKKI